MAASEQVKRMFRNDELFWLGFATIFGAALMYAALNDYYPHLAAYKPESMRMVQFGAGAFIVAVCASASPHLVRLYTDPKYLQETVDKHLEYDPDYGTVR